MTLEPAIRLWTTSADCRWIIIKIDRSFTLDIGRSESAEELIRVMIAIAHTLGLQVVAEGIETQAQLQFLQGARLRSRPGLPV